MWKLLLPILALGLLGVALLSCALSGPPGAALPSPTAITLGAPSLPSAVETPPVRPVDLPMPEWTDVPPFVTTSPWTPEPWVSPTPTWLEATSPRVAPGRAYPLQLYTHCGLDWWVDFDGSWWV